MLILTHSVLSMVTLIHRKKEDTSDHGFSRHILYNRRSLTPGKTKSRDENKAATPTEQGNFYWERRLFILNII